MDEDTEGFCTKCGAPLTVKHTRSHTCRPCQLHSAKLKQRMPSWAVIEARINAIVPSEAIAGNCFLGLDRFPSGPIKGHKI